VTRVGPGWALHRAAPERSLLRTPRAGLRPAHPPRGSRKLGAALRFLERSSPKPLKVVEEQVHRIDELALPAEAGLAGAHQSGTAALLEAHAIAAAPPLQVGTLRNRFDRPARAGDDFAALSAAAS